MATIFQLGGADALDLWGASAPATIVSFGVNDAPPETLWRVDLPDAADAAAAILARAGADIAASNTALDDAARRMRAFDPRLAVVESFGVGDRATPDSESELRALLLDDPAVVSFGIGAVMSDTWQSAVERFEQFTAWVRDAVGASSRVETRIGGHLIAVTRLSVTGDLRTVWATVRASETAQHERALALMLASRAVMLRTVVVTLGGAVGLAATLARPDAIIRAVPAALRFIETVRAELRKPETAREVR
ncbi:MAG: hypothetical protein SGI73_09405 [Chloroflexota bacterium]|nr:hypothetical protein [Chloroflexota bacterium]